MDGNIQKALWLGVGIMIFLAVVMIGMTALSKGQDMSAESMSALDDNAKVLANAQYSMYDDQMVSGTDVIDSIKKFKNADMTVVIGVDTASATSVNYTTTALAATALMNMQTKGHGAYVNPYGEFYATLDYDAAGILETIDFVQQ